MKAFPTLFGCEAGGKGHVVAVGVPYDRGTDPDHTGAAAAPSLLRALSGPEQSPVAGGALYDLGCRTRLFTGAALSDLGNLRFDAGRSDDGYLAEVSGAIATIAHAGKRPLVLGGDHLVTLAVLRGFAQLNRALQVIQIDAHHDFDENIRPDDRPTHATFISAVVAERLAVRVVQIGVRGLSAHLPRLPADLRSVALAELAAVLLPATDVYLTIDTDGFDPASAPGVAFPVPDGLPFAALAQVIETVRAAGLSIVGADWTEYNPRFDSANHVTGRFVVRGLAELVHTMAPMERS